MVCVGPERRMCLQHECLIEYSCDPLPGQGINFQAKSWHSLRLTANLEFNEKGWSIGDSNLGHPCLPEMWCTLRLVLHRHFARCAVGFTFRADTHTGLGAAGNSGQFSGQRCGELGAPRRRACWGSRWAAGSRS
jgi:hypothetical protein